MTAAFIFGALAGAGLALALTHGTRNLFRAVALDDAADFLDACALKVRGGLMAPERLALLSAALGLRAWAKKPGGGRENMPPVPAPPWEDAAAVTHNLVTAMLDELHAREERRAATLDRAGGPDQAAEGKAAETGAADGAPQVHGGCGIAEVRS